MNPKMVLTYIEIIIPTFLHCACWRISARLTENGGQKKEVQNWTIVGNAGPENARAQQLSDSSLKQCQQSSFTSDLVLHFPVLHFQRTPPFQCYRI